MSSSAAAIKGSGSGVSKAKLSTPAKEDIVNAKGKAVAISEVKKKVDASGKPAAVNRPNSVNARVKSEVKTIVSSSKAVTKTTGTKNVKTKTEKKVYSLSGQKYDPPEEREPLRIFYESLSNQIPTSEMAEFWMMEHGLFSPERAKKAYERKQKRQQQLRSGAPIKMIKEEKPESSKKLQISKNGDTKANKRVDYSDNGAFDSKPKKQKS